MKYQRILILFFTLLTFACNSLTRHNDSLEKTTSFGDDFNDSTVTLVNMDSLLHNKPEARPMDAVFTGRVTSICKSRGCWIKLDAGNGKEVFVDTNESFTMPQSIVGKNVTVSGYAFMDTTDIQALRQYAKEEGKSKEDIEKINEPLIEVSIKATGIKIK